MFVSWRDLLRNPKRFALVGGVVALVAMLATVLTGLAHGLVSDGVSGLRGMPVTHLVFQQGAKATFSRSSLDNDQLAAWQKERSNIKVTPLGMTFVNAATSRGGHVDIALVGVRPGAFFTNLSEAEQRRALSGIVLDESVRADTDVQIGDTLQLGAATAAVRVVGFTGSGSYGHVPIAYVSLERWQQVMYGNDARGRFSALAVRTDDEPAAAALARRTGTELLTKKEAYAGSPGYTPETLTMTMIRGFLLVISALIVGAFFTVLTVQRTRQIAVMKALGASGWFLARDALGQVAVLVTLATAAGGLLGVAMISALASTDAPVELSVGGVAQTAAILIVVSLLGSLAALRNTASIEPATALAAEEL